MGIKCQIWLLTIAARDVGQNVPRGLQYPQEAARPMDTNPAESIPIVVGQEDDGRWRADIESMPGVMADGPARCR